MDPLMESKTDKAQRPQDVAIVTGPSGAGRSTAIAALEDLGFEAIDNLPLSLLLRLFSGGAHDKPVAVGVDARTRDFTAARVVETLEALAKDPAVSVSLVYLIAGRTRCCGGIRKPGGGIRWHPGTRRWQALRKSWKCWRRCGRARTF